MSETLTLELRWLDRAAMQPWLPLLDEWLLPGALYGAQHTWPQLYRSDGDGRFATLFAGERMLSCCAFRFATLHTNAGVRRTALLGSVATDPALRGQGLASQLLRTSLDACKQGGAELVLLWAEQPRLYERCGFRNGALEVCCALTARFDDVIADDGTVATVRFATIADHARLHELHDHKPMRVDRSPHAMSALLTTPGLQTVVLERSGEVVAYACTGKGADLQGWWHEVGGADADVAAMLPRALALAGHSQAIALVPPYRLALPRLLGDCRLETATVAGPMVCSLSDRAVPMLFVDGLDSV